MSTSTARQRGGKMQIRLDPAELAKVQADAEAVGLSLSGYGRTMLLGIVTPGTQRRAPRDAVELARLSGLLGKAGSNLNQLTKLGNQGQIVPPSALNAVIAHLDDLLSQLDEVLSGDR
jgi:hypothetical protein